MDEDHAAASLWRTRITWAALGAGVTALLMWDRGTDPTAAEPRLVEATAQPGSDAARPDVSTSGPTDGASSPEPAGDAHPTSGTAATTGLELSTESAATTGLELSTESAATMGLDAATEGAATTGLDASTGTTSSGDEALPLIPLPRMPGSRFMRQARRPDEETGGSLIIQGLSVPAPGVQVEAFYRRAMKDAGLRVFGGSSASSGMGEGHRSTLKGRGKHASADITIHQRAGRLRSVVRIYWRAKD